MKSIASKKAGPSSYISHNLTRLYMHCNFGLGLSWVKPKLQCINIINADGENSRRLLPYEAPPLRSWVGEVGEIPQQRSKAFPLYFKFIYRLGSVFDTNRRRRVPPPPPANFVRPGLRQSNALRAFFLMHRDFGLTPFLILFQKLYVPFLKNSGRYRKIFYIALCLSAYSMSCQRGAAAEFRVAQFGEGPKIFTD